MSRHAWYVTTPVSVQRHATRKAAEADLATKTEGWLIRECDCGCGLPAGKPTLSVRSAVAL